MAELRLIAAKGKEFSSVSIVPGKIQGGYANEKHIRAWCKDDATKLFRLLRKNLPFATYSEFRRLIYLELLKDSE